MDNDDDNEDDDNYGAQLVTGDRLSQSTLICSLLCFWLLQEIEENFGGALETVKIEEIMIDFLEEPWLTFLSLRHQEKMVRFDRCEFRENVEAKKGKWSHIIFCTLLSWSTFPPWKTKT